MDRKSTSILITSSKAVAYSDKKLYRIVTFFHGHFFSMYLKSDVFCFPLKGHKDCKGEYVSIPAHALDISSLVKFILQSLLTVHA